MIGCCAKQRVQCVIKLRGVDKIIHAENLCTNPQEICPRVKGEGYLKCHSICGQLGHAEANAIKILLLAGYAPSDVESITVFNHDRPCDACRCLLDSYGLLAVTVFKGRGETFTLPYESIEEITEAFNLNEPSSHSRFVAGLRSSHTDDEGIKCLQ